MINEWQMPEGDHDMTDRMREISDGAMRFRAEDPVLQKNVFTNAEFSDDEYLSYNIQ